MTRLIVYIVLSLLLTAGAAWVVSLPGTITIDLAGYRLQPGLGTTAIALVAFVIAAILVWSILRRIIDAPRLLARRARHRRRQLGFEALSDSFIALEAGDHSRARDLAREAQNRLPGSAAAQLLEARADLALGHLGAAREQYRALIANPKTALAALSGLYDQARAQGRPDLAITFARKATGLAPGVIWAETAVIDDLTAKSAWSAALEMIAAQPANSRAARATRRRRQTVLNTAIAATSEPTDPALALIHAQAALKLDADFVPAALIQARILASRGEVRRAQSLLRRVWRNTGHPDIATLFANAQPGASAMERYKRARDLIGIPPADRGAALVLAHAAIEAYEWAAARNALAPFLSEPTQNVCTLLAEIEEGQNADQGKAREWLGRALRAPRDPTWIADGITSDEWEPVSPVTGKLDAFEWKVPVSAVAYNRRTGDNPEAPFAAPALPAGSTLP